MRESLKNPLRMKKVIACQKPDGWPDKWPDGSTKSEYYRASANCCNQGPKYGNILLTCVDLV